MKVSRVFMAAMVAVASAAVAQCSKSPESPTSPGAVSATASGTQALGGLVSADPTLTEIRVCRSASSNVSGNVDIVLVSGAGAVLSPIALTPGECRTAAIDTSTSGGSSISVTDVTAGSVNPTLMRNDNGSVSGPTAFSNGSQLFLNSFHGFTVTFTNTVSTGNEGCTPGYWKQSQHFDSWVGYLTTDNFDTVFGVNFFNPDLTLLEAVSQNGSSNPFAALGRNAVAALLNSTNPGVSYAYTTAQVIDIVQGDGAYAGLTIAQRTALLSTENVKGCPLN